MRNNSSKKKKNKFLRINPKIVYAIIQNWTNSLLKSWEGERSTGRSDPRDGCASSGSVLHSLLVSLQPEDLGEGK